MSFKDRRRERHEQQPVDELEQHTGISVQEFKESIIEMVRDIPGAKIVEEKPPVQLEITAGTAEEQLETTAGDPPELEDIPRLEKRERKKREDLKEVNNVGLVGDTIEARDFRAICKKGGIQINVALTQILRDWNMAHYNL